MKELRQRGIAASNGIAVGKLRFLKNSVGKLPSYTVYHIESEIQRFQNAVKIAVGDLTELYEKEGGESGGEGAEIFFMHRMMLDDPDLNEITVKNIKENKSSRAEHKKVPTRAPKK